MGKDKQKQERQIKLSIYRLEEYKEFIQSIVRKVPILRTEQLSAALVNTYDVNYKDALAILRELQNVGVLLLSEDGYAMTRQAYLKLMGGRKIEGAKTSYAAKISPMHELVAKNEYYLNLIDCMWIVVDMLPLSQRFVVCPEPWDIVFDTASDDDNPSMFYQITRIPADREDVRCELLKCVRKISDYMRDKTVRIAIMDNENHNWMVPHIGFSHIVKLDPSNYRHYVITETRSGDDLWSFFE